MGRAKELKSFLTEITALTGMPDDCEAGMPDDCEAVMPDDCQAVIDAHWRRIVYLPPTDQDKYYQMLVHHAVYVLEEIQISMWQAMYVIAKHPRRWVALAADVLEVLKNVAKAMHKDVLEGRLNLDSQLAKAADETPRLMEMRTVEPGATSADVAGLIAAPGSGEAGAQAIAQLLRELKEACEANTAEPSVHVAYYVELFSHPAVRRNLVSCLHYIMGELSFAANAGAEPERLRLGDAVPAEDECRLPAWKVLQALEERPHLEPLLQGFAHYIKRMIEDHAEHLPAAAPA